VPGQEREHTEVNLHEDLSDTKQRNHCWRSKQFHIKPGGFRYNSLLILHAVVILTVLAVTPLGGLLPFVISGFASGYAKELAEHFLKGEKLMLKSSSTGIWNKTTILRGSTK